MFGRNNRGRSRRRGCGGGWLGWYRIGDGRIELRLARECGFSRIVVGALLMSIVGGKGFCCLCVDYWIGNGRFVVRV